MEASPITIIESYFDRGLTRSALRSFDKVSDDQWIDFAKHYLAQMKNNFTVDFLQPPTTHAASLRLYFEPRISHAWDAAVLKQYRQTPLLGLNPRPPSQDKLTRAEVSNLLNPLKKHLLLADSVYFRDSFYYCFDAVADSVDRTKWRSNPNVVNLVHDSIRAIKNWLPILIELRAFIESKALVFMPYYITPSFPYGGTAPNIREHYKKLRLRDDSEGSSKNYSESVGPEAVRRYFSRSFPPYNEDDVVGAWLNGRLLHLDPVFPNKAMSDWAARLYFDDGPDTPDVTSDLVSIQILPFGGVKDIELDELWRIRKDEKVFDEVQRIVAACKAHIETNMGTSATKQGVNEMCRTFLHDQLAQYEKNSVLKFLKIPDQNPIAGIGFTLAVGAALLAVNPVVGLIAGAVLTPQVALAVKKQFNPTQRAYGHLQALL